MKFPAFLGTFYSTQARRINQERLVNFYIENVGSESPGSAAPRALMPTPGFRQFAVPPAGEGRGIYSQNDRTFAVVGDQLVEIHANGTYTVRPLTALADFATAPTVVQSDPTPALAVPNPPTVQQGGAIGVTSYGYKIAATNALGSSIASLEGTIATGHAALDAGNFNHITWDAVPNATGYKIWRTTGGTTPPRLIGTVTDASIRFFQDIGQAGTADVPPAVDSSAGTAGVDTRGYRVAGVIGIGTTAASAETTAPGYATLTAINHMKISWPAIPNAQSYRIWRTTGPGVTLPLLIGEVDGATLEFKDTGQAGEINTPPSGNTTTTLALVNDGSPVSICSSGDAGQQLFIMASGKGYVLDLRTNVFAQVIDGVTFGDYLSGYFIALDAATSTFRWSGILNGFSWTDTDYQQRTAAADKWIAMAVQNEEIWLIGTESAEIWVHTGAPEPAAPFSRQRSVFVEKGIGPSFSLAKVEGTLFWLQQDRRGGGVVVRTEGYRVVRISTHALENQIQNYSSIADAEAFAYQKNGHTFYVLSFPGEGRTWAYDLATQEWAELGHWEASARDYSVYRPRAHAYSFQGITAGLHLVVDREDGKIYEMSEEISTDIDSRPIRRLRRAPFVANNQRQIVHDELEILLETGVNAPQGMGAKPTLMLRWSDDNGFTWSSEHWVSTGALGQHAARAIWRQLGSSRHRAYELVVTDPIPWTVTGAQINIRAGIH